MVPSGNRCRRRHATSIRWRPRVPSWAPPKRGLTYEMWAVGNVGLMEDVSPPEACHAMLTHLGELQCSQSGAGYSSTCSSQKLSVAVVRTIRNVGYLNIRKSSPKLMPQSRYQAGLLALH